CSGSKSFISEKRSVTFSSVRSPASVFGTVMLTSGLNSESTLLRLFLLTLIFFLSDNGRLSLPLLKSPTVSNLRGNSTFFCAPPVCNASFKLMRALGTSFWNVSAIAVPFLKECLLKLTTFLNKSILEQNATIDQLLGIKGQIKTFLKNFTL